MWLFYIFIIQIQDFFFFQTQACFFIQVYPPLCDSNCLALADKVQSFETRLFYMITWMFYEVFLGYVPIPEIIKELDLADKKSFWIEIFEKLQLLFRILINTFCSVALKNKYFLIYKFLLESTAFRILFKLPIGRNNIVAAKIIVSENKLLLLSGGAIVQGCRDQMYYQSNVFSMISIELWVALPICSQFLDILCHPVLDAERTSTAPTQSTLVFRTKLN